MERVILLISMIAYLLGVVLATSLRGETSPKEDEKMNKKGDDEDFFIRRRRDTGNIQPLSVGAGMGQNINPLSYQASYFVGQCVMCPPGPAGPPGPPGTQGKNGRDGRDAVVVVPAAKGSSSLHVIDPEGSSGEVSNRTGVTYVRWGRTTCPPTSELLYEGAMAGSHYTHKGGGANHLCLPHDPIFDEPVAGHQGASYLYGAEYQTSSWFPPYTSLHDVAVPCALCFTPGKIHTLMVPGRNVCPTGQDWTLEYNGYIVSEHHNHRRSEYLCLDRNAEGIERTSGNQDEALLYVVEISCGASRGIPCPPYVHGYEVTCAVCSL